MKNKLKKVAAIILTAACILGCHKQEKPHEDEILTDEFSIVCDSITLTSNSASFYGTYLSSSTIEQLSVIIRSASSQTESRSILTLTQNMFSGTVLELEPETVYNYQYEARFCNNHVVRTRKKSFSTEKETSFPTVRTISVDEITSHSAICDSEVVSDGGSPVIEKGVCWATTLNPTINDHICFSDTGLNLFVCELDQLESNTVYYIRAFATNSIGTSYGEEIKFSTIIANPEGACDGAFSINSNGQKVYFSKGNLQYKASTQTWRFAEKQWDYVGGHTLVPSGGTVEGSSNDLISETYDGWIDMFGWGTSGKGHGAVCYQPWSTSRVASDYYAYGSVLNNLYYESGQADWGCNAIYNGGNQENFGWRTLTSLEWDYVLNCRPTNYGFGGNRRFAMAFVNGVFGLILFPDVFKWPDAAGSEPYNFNSGYPPPQSLNPIQYSAEQFAIIESNGAVFLPKAGSRDGIYHFNSHCYYWSADQESNNYSWALCFSYPGYVLVSNMERWLGLAVRLVYPIE